MLEHGSTLEALADPTRRAIVEQLRDGPLAVGELARQLPVSRPAVSQHLAVLKRGGLVSERRAGTRHIYRLEQTGLSPLRAYLEGLWDDVMNAYRRAAEQEAGRQ